MTYNIKCLECNDSAVWIVWGCCEYYRTPMCDMHAQSVASDVAPDCEPIDLEGIEEYMTRSNGYGFTR